MFKETRQFKLKKDFLILSITTLVTVLCWIFFQLYWTMSKSTISKLTRKQMATLKPKLNSQAIPQLKSQLFFTDEELQQELKPISTESATPKEQL